MEEVARLDNRRNFTDEEQFLMALGFDFSGLKIMRETRIGGPQMMRMRLVIIPLVDDFSIKIDSQWSC